MQKNHLGLIIALLAVSFGAYIYFYPPVKKHNSRDEVPPVANCVDCEQETEGQTLAHFKNVVKNYRETIWDTVNAANFGLTTRGVPNITTNSMFSDTDARTIWFDMDTIKRFFCTIEKYNKQLANPGTGLGIRFFYAAYDSTDADTSRRNRHTLFMTPTYKAQDGSNIDFDPRETFFQQTATNNDVYKKEFQGQNLSYVNLYRPSVSMSLISPLALILGPDNNLTGRASIVNNGEICPTNCPSVNTLQEIDR